MLKTLLRLLLEGRGKRYDHRSPYSYKPWKKPKKSRRPYGWHGDDRYGYGDRYGHMPPGYHRPRGLKGMIIDAILRRLLKR